VPDAAGGGYWQGVARALRRDPASLASGVVVLLIFALAAFAPWLAPADPYKASMLRRLLPIGSAGFPLGTDEWAATWSRASCTAAGSRS